MTVRLQREDFDISVETRQLTAGRTDVGAVVSFTGICRDGPQGDRISAMTLDHYPAMAQAELERLEAQARERWPLQDALIIHRHGRLVPGDNIVLVLTLSAHRQAAFEAAEFLMDYLKTRAPFWKKEERSAGSDWVSAKSEDDKALERWSSGENR